MVNKLKIAIDQQLAATYGPEIHWAWRLLLTGAGWAWEQVALDSGADGSRPSDGSRPIDIAYGIEPSQAPRAALFIRADPTLWAQPAACRFGGIAGSDGAQWLRFADGASAGDRCGADPLADPFVIEQGRAICHRDLVFDLFWLVSGQEERSWPQDKHGFYDLTGTALLRDRVLQRAIASQSILWLQKTLLELGYPPPVPRWPHGKRAAAAVGHDVDYPEVKRWLEPLRIVGRQGRQGLGPALDVLFGKRHHWQFPAWVEMEKGLQTRSAFYFVSRRGSLLEYATGRPDPFYDVTSERFHELFDFLSTNGFEIGLHTSYLAYQSREQLAAEKQRLEEAAGQPVVGNRHHYWHMNPDDVEQTLLFHEQIGLKYDSSLVHNHYMGWRRGLSWPFYPFHQGERREIKTLQVSTTWMDEQLFRLAGRESGNSLENLRGLADCAAQQGGCLLIDVHEYVFDDLLFPDWAGTYRNLWQEILDRGDFWFATPAQIAEHWTGRHAAIVQASRGLGEGQV